MEVLPSLRKTGSYSITRPASQLDSDQGPGPGSRLLRVLGLSVRGGGGGRLLSLPLARKQGTPRELLGGAVMKEEQARHLDYTALNPRMQRENLQAGRKKGG